jgi:hypothetical protein
MTSGRAAVRNAYDLGSASNVATSRKNCFVLNHGG